MDKFLDLYTVVAERETGFWVGLPATTGKTVPRDDWLRKMRDDPEHFQLARLTAEELTRYSTADEDVIERAVYVAWSDETAHLAHSFPEEGDNYAAGGRV